MFLEYFASSFIALVIIGAILHVVDMNWGVAFKRMLWNMTHSKRDKMPKDRECGFIFNRLAKARARAAVVVAIVATFVGTWYGHANPLLEVLSIIPATVALVIGFYLGQPLARLLGMTETVLERVEGVEKRVAKGETTWKSEATTAARGAGERLRERVAGIDTPPDAAPLTVPTSPTATKEPPPAEKPKPVEPDPADAIRKFTGRN